MLGYMAVRKPELRFREFDRYRGYYCGVCHALAGRCGAPARLGLNFEMTFLAMLLTALADEDPQEDAARCPLHPLRKRLVLRSEAIDYCADLSAMLVYDALRDGWTDEHRLDRLAESAALAGAARRAGERWPRQKEALAAYLKSLAQVEKAREENLDAAAELTGTLLAEVMILRPSPFDRDLRTLGFSLGKFIYLCDAYEDLERDARTGAYNPLLSRRDAPDFDAFCEAMLGALMAEATAAFERLPVLSDVEIMRNILYSGIWQRFEQTQAKRKAKQA